MLPVNIAICDVNILNYGQWLYGKSKNRIIRVHDVNQLFSVWFFSPHFISFCISLHGSFYFCSFDAAWPQQQKKPVTHSQLNDGKSSRKEKWMKIRDDEDDDEIQYKRILFANLSNLQEFAFRCMQYCRCMRVADRFFALFFVLIFFYLREHSHLLWCCRCCCCLYLMIAPKMVNLNYLLYSL